MTYSDFDARWKPTGGAERANYSLFLQDLWQKMDTGGFSSELKTRLRRFNGKLFHDARALLPTARTTVFIPGLKESGYSM